MEFMSLMGRQIAVRVPSHRSGWVCDGANGHPTAFRLSQVDTKRIIATQSISAKLPVSADIVIPSPTLRTELPCGDCPSQPTCILRTGQWQARFSQEVMCMSMRPGHTVTDQNRVQPSRKPATNSSTSVRTMSASIKPLDHMSSSISRSRTSAACFLAAKIKSRADSPRTQQSTMSAQHCIMMRRSAVYRATL